MNIEGMGSMKIYQYTIIVIMLIHSITDIKYKKVRFEVTLVGLIIGTLFIILDIWNGIFPYKKIGGILFGIACLILGKITNEEIGYGDGMILCMLGLFYHTEQIFIVIFWASLFAIIVALFLIIIFQKNRKYEMPFIPFLTLGMLMEKICV